MWPDGLTFDRTVDSATNVVWSPAGDRVLFSANPDGTFELFWKQLGSSRPPQLLLASPNPKYAMDWSRDGRHVLYTELDPESQADIWTVSIEEGADGIRAAQPVPFLKTPFLESGAQLSPDGRWVAYVSSESGTVELYVRSFPSGDGKRKISTRGSREPRWSADGSELFFLSGPTMTPSVMVVALQHRPTVAGEPDLEIGAPRALFGVRANSFHPATGTFFYAVSADATRFLVSHIDGAAEPAVNIVTSWQTAFDAFADR